jgi:type IV fimbrial biogenesis protein FimT
MDMDKNNRQPATDVRNSGFTLIEMMVTVVLLAVLIAAVAPSFRGVILDNRAATQANALVSSLMLARSEAIKRNARVVICQSDSGATCDDSDWTTGWILWADTNADTVIDTGEIVQTQDKLASRFTLTPEPAGPSVTYLPDGSLLAAGSFELLSPDGDADYGRCIDVDLTGRPRVTKGTCP